VVPLYDFSCTSCGRAFEARAAVGELSGCPECGSENTEKRLTPFAGPFTVRPRGEAARRADAARRVREERRAERREARRQARGQS
jgi:putative FmdB family regulatory protein